MPKPDAVRRLSTVCEAPEANGSTKPPQLKNRSTARRHHIALFAALVVTSLLALSLPLVQSKARRPDSADTSSEYLTASVVVAAGGGAVGNLSDPASSVHPGGITSRASIPRSNVVPMALLEATARAVAGTIVDPANSAAPLIIERRAPQMFTLHEDGFTTTQMAADTTVGAALSALGVAFGEHDMVWPSPSAALAPGTHVYVRHATQIRLLVANVEKEYFTQARTVGELLAEPGVGYEATDHVSPASTTAIRQGIQVNVTTIRTTNEETNDPVDFDTVYRYDPDRPDGEYVVLQAGSQGTIHREYRVQRINGVEVKREFVRDSWEPATQRIVRVGTFVAPTPRPFVAAVPPGADGCAQTLSVYATWYTSSSAGGSTTATGTAVYKGIVAVDPRVIPLGTRMYIPGYGYGVAADTGGGIKGNMIDLGYGADDVFDWRTRWVDICILP